MTTDITIIDSNGRELMLELNATAYVPATRHSPPEDPEFEILKITTPEGEILDDTTLEFIVNTEEDQIWQKLYDLDEGTHEDYLLEKHAEEHRERYLEERLRRIGPCPERQ